MARSAATSSTSIRTATATSALLKAGSPLPADKSPSRAPGNLPAARESSRVLPAAAATRAGRLHPWKLKIRGKERTRSRQKLKRHDSSKSSACRKQDVFHVEHNAESQKCSTWDISKMLTGHLYK